MKRAHIGISAQFYLCGNKKRCRFCDAEDTFLKDQFEKDTSLNKVKPYYRDKTWSINMSTDGQKAHLYKYHQNEVKLLLADHYNLRLGTGKEQDSVTGTARFAKFKLEIEAWNWSLKWWAGSCRSLNNDFLSFSKFSNSYLGEFDTQSSKSRITANTTSMTSSPPPPIDKQRKYVFVNKFNFNTLWKTNKIIFEAFHFFIYLFYRLNHHRLQHNKPIEQHRTHRRFKRVPLFKLLRHKRLQYHPEKIRRKLLRKNSRKDPENEFRA